MGEIKALELRRILVEMDLLIRQGRADVVHRQCQALKRSEIPRELLADFANIARRLQWPQLMIYFLRPIVRPANPVFPPPTTRELALYGVGLTRIGAFSEASELLYSLDGGSEPDVYLFQALLEINQWNYQDAILPLKRFIKSRGVSEYSRNVGKLNLAACLISKLWVGRATELIYDLLENTSSPGMQLLHANTLELAAQLSLHQGNLREMENYLELSKRLLTGSQSQYEFLIRKWSAILDLSRNKAPTVQISSVQEEAVRRRDWETLRDCDFYKARVLGDTELFLKVYFGTSFASYRARVRTLFGYNSPIPLIYLRELSAGTVSEPIILEPENWSAPKSLMRMFRILNQDFYKPVSLGELFNSLYKGEYYNPDTSAQKVFRLITRLRQYFGANSIPLRIDIEDGQCFLRSQKWVRYQVARIQRPSTKISENQLKILRQTYRNEAFGAQGVSKILHISRRTACRWLNHAEQSGVLRKTANGRATRYKLVS